MAADSASAPPEQPSGAESTQNITPWDVQGGADGKIDYDRLCRQFGCSRLSDSHIERVERLTGMKPHPLLRRGVFFSHRDFEAILDAHEQGKPWYLYTGRGPSSEALHLGHLVPFMFTKWLQDAFKVPLVIQLTDDEKFLWRDLELAESERLAHENIKDIIACGFDVNKTFIFTDFKYRSGHFNRNITSISRLVTFNSIRAIFGLKGEDCIGKIAFPATQAAPAFPTSFPHMFGQRKDIRCLIPCAIDQDPYFRMTRDVAPKLGFHKCSLIMSRFFPALQGESGKMNASDPNSAIFVTDSAKQIKNKLNKYALTGGQDTKELQIKHGANLEVDVPWKYLNFFLDDDAELAEIGKRYSEGDESMMSGHVKKRLAEVLAEIVLRHQEARKNVTDAVVDSFTSPRDMTSCLHH
ncbi:hypothetical protein WJX73_008494 [Symbiochloris irregularis]|uniref:Tryptophan--tRNA ligase, cytoplasmic n=1 Tax=Symbiochloris irregularis TaxID=706552 RepID=A0AAW1P2A9_9CHLO